jgi:hypothetical protein
LPFGRGASEGTEDHRYLSGGELGSNLVFLLLEIGVGVLNLAPSLLGDKGAYGRCAGAASDHKVDFVIVLFYFD